MSVEIIAKVWSKSCKDDISNALLIVSIYRSYGTLVMFINFATNISCLRHFKPNILIVKSFVMLIDNWTSIIILNIN